MPAPKRTSKGRLTKAPPGLLFREAEPDWRGALTALADVFTTDAKKAASALLKAAKSVFQLKPKKLDEELYLLIKRAVARAIVSTIASVSQQLAEPTQSRREAAKKADFLSNHPIEVRHDFFRNPIATPIVGTAVRSTVSWLRAFDCDHDMANEAAAHLPARFIECLAGEIAENASEYKKILDRYKPKFDSLAELESAWAEYFAKLAARANPTVLDLGVSLDQVYIDLRAYIRLPNRDIRDESAERSRDSRQIGMINDFLDEWLENSVDSICIISGGPGAGKSALARRYAAYRAWAGPESWRVLYVPLHRFSVGSDLSAALELFASEEIGCPAHLLDRASASRTLIIFDGLDELAKQGRMGEELAYDFMVQVESLARHHNRESEVHSLNILVCGRPVAVTNSRADARYSGRVKYLLPYLLTGNNQLQKYWTGRTHLCEIDQRDEWWEKFGIASGDATVTGLPPDVKDSRLEQLTTEPILNGLIARCRTQRKITPSTTRAQIYEWLLRDVLTRFHDRSGKQHLTELQDDDVIRLLEEVAVTAWHSGDVRATTQRKVIARCRKSGCEPLLERVFPTASKSDISSLFLAFYFQQSKQRVEQEPAFEFTHKSFGEYLLARRIASSINTISDRFKDSIWDADYCAMYWAELFGPSHLTADTLDFFDDICAARRGEVGKWRSAILSIANRVASASFPMHKLELPTFSMMRRRCDNAMHALFVLQGRCHKNSSGTRSADRSASALFERLLFSNGYIDFMSRQSARGLNFDESTIVFLNLIGVDFSDSSLVGAQFGGCHLSGSVFDNADLSRAYFTDFCDTYPLVVHIDKAVPHPSIVTPCDLSYCSFKHANLTNSHFENCSMRGANIDGANLSGATISHDALAETTGTPAFLPDGSVPRSDWRAILATSQQ